MAKVVFAPETAEDFERITGHLLAHDAADIGGRLDSILDGCAILERHPRIGRPVGAPGRQRELLIGKGSRAYAALYRYLEPADLVVVTAVRAQRERGYRRDDPG